MSDWSFSIYDFGYIFTKLKTIADNPPVEIYMKKTKSKIFFKIKTGYKGELLLKETMQLLQSTKKDIDQNKHAEIVL